MYPTVNEPDHGPTRAAFELAVAETPTTSRDVGTVELARRYADAIDGGKDLDRVGSQYLSVLTALGMTPASRALLVKGGPDGAGGETGGNQRTTDDLHNRRVARQHNP